MDITSYRTVARVPETIRRICYATLFMKNWNVYYPNAILFQNDIVITVIVRGTLMNFENTVITTYTTIINIKNISVLLTYLLHGAESFLSSWLACS